MSEHNDRLGELYEAALKEPIGERAAFVAARAGGDLELQQRVLALFAKQQDTQVSGADSPTGSAATSIAAGTQIGTYRIDGRLGAGGMGVVYRATDTKLHRPAAIKVLPENLADPEARRRFQREAQMVSSLNHPHILTVYDAGEYLGRQYLITEFVDGGTLRQWAARPRGWRAIVELLIGVADGIATAHDAGILHRDIKPENILLAKNGYAKLADFGLAKLVESDPLADEANAFRGGEHSTLVGTAAYMSPEQTQGLPLDGRSDVYSFGLVLYELLAGSRPFDDEPGRRRGTEAEPIPPLPAQVPADLRAIVAKALEPEPADRYQTMRDLVVDLRRLVRRSGVDARGTDLPADAPELVRERTGPIAPPRAGPRWLVTLVAAIALLAVTAWLGRGYLGQQPTTGGSIRVAVLPFVNEGGNPDDLPVSDGVGDALREQLSPLRGLRVAATASSIAFRDQPVDLRTVASRLDVTDLVSGRVRRRAGDDLRVAVEIIDGETADIEFSRSYEGDLVSIGQQLVSDVSAHLLPQGTETPATPAPTIESAAATALSFGLYFERQVRAKLVVDEVALAKAIEQYRRAVAADPKSELAYSRLAGTLLIGGDADGALLALTKALEFGQLSETYYTLALYCTAVGGSWAASIEGAYQRALQLNPNNADALGAYALWGWTHRDGRDAQQYFLRALELDPLSPSRYADYGEYLAAGERRADLLALATLTRERFPNVQGNMVLARMYEIAGDVDEGIGWALRALELTPGDPDVMWQLADLYARIGDFETARLYEPEPGLSQLYFEQRYLELVDAAEAAMLEEDYDQRAVYMLAFALNVRGEFSRSIYLLEDREKLLDRAFTDSNRAGDSEAFMTWADAKYASGFGDEARPYLEMDIEHKSRSGSIERQGWWVNTYYACAMANLGQTEAALRALERAAGSMGLLWLPLLEDAWCFKRFKGEPRYEAVVARVVARQKMLRERLPMTLREKFSELGTSATN